MDNEKKEKIDKKPKLKRSIGTLLLTILMPITIIGIAVIIIFLTSKAQTVIVDLTKADLKAETYGQAQDMGSSFKMLTSKFGQYADTLEMQEFKGKEDIKNYIKHSLDYSPVDNSGIYIGYDDGDYVFANGTVIDGDYDPTTRDWYKIGMENETFKSLPPYMDLATNKLCFSYVRRVDFYDGSKGVMAVDIYLDVLQDQINNLRILETGQAIVIDTENDFIISFFDPALNGESISEANDVFLNNSIAHIDSGSEEILETKDDTGANVYICAAAIPGTTWSLVSTIHKSNALAKLNSFKVAAYTIMVIVILAMLLAILFSIRKVVSAPIQALADKIEIMAGGDFTVELPKSKGDEIGLIQDELNTYAGKMRNLINNIQETAGKLQDQANDSKNIAGNMTDATQQQSESVLMIRDSMEGISNAVTEIANNATELAGAVSDLNDIGDQTGKVTQHLIERANAGKADMKAVQTNMDNISTSMNEMNAAVDIVGESAKKITGIIEIINSIAEQTNLLSLNASIEAARAGETGRGFAVVASEIATLASDSSSSTEKIAAIITDITEQIQSLSDKSNANVDAITRSSAAVVTAEETFEKLVSDLGEVGNSMQDMNHRIESIDEISSSMAAISEEQSASSQEILNTTEDLASTAQQVAASSHDVDNSATTVSDSAAEISKSLEVFRI